MKLRWLLITWISLSAFCQNEVYDLRDQIGLIKDLMPDAQVVGDHSQIQRE